MKTIALLALLSIPCLAAQTKTDEQVVGVGVEIKIAHGWPEVVALIKGSPAAKDGRLKPGDRIEAVAQGEEAWENTHGLTLAAVTAKIRGKRGSMVILRATRQTEEGARLAITVELKREPIKVPAKL